MADPHLMGNGRLREAQLAQGHDLIVESKTLLSSGLLLLGCFWTQFQWLPGLVSFERGGREVLGLAVAMSGKMMRQHPRESLSQIFDQMEAIRTLRGLGSTSSRSRSIFPSPISTHDFNFGMLSHPSCS